LLLIKKQHLRFTLVGFEELEMQMVFSAAEVWKDGGCAGSQLPSRGFWRKLATLQERSKINQQEIIDEKGEKTPFPTKIIIRLL